MPTTQVKIDKYVSREIQIIVGVIAVMGAFYTMVLLPLSTIKAELALSNANYEYIKNNDLRHIEDKTTELTRRMDDNDTEHKRIEEQLTRLITLQEASNREHGITVP